MPKTTIEVAERRLSALCRSTFFPRASLRVRSTEDEDSPERATAVRSPQREAERAAERCSRGMTANQGFFDGIFQAAVLCSVFTVMVYSLSPSESTLPLLSTMVTVRPSASTMEPEQFSVVTTLSPVTTQLGGRVDGQGAAAVRRPRPRRFRRRALAPVKTRALRQVTGQGWRCCPRSRCRSLSCWAAVKMQSAPFWPVWPQPRWFCVAGAAQEVLAIVRSGDQCHIAQGRIRFRCWWCRTGRR